MKRSFGGRTLAGHKILRPFLRRRFKTRRPPGVRILARKPETLRRFRLVPTPDTSA